MIISIQNGWSSPPYSLCHFYGASSKCKSDRFHYKIAGLLSRMRSWSLVCYFYGGSSWLIVKLRLAGAEDPWIVLIFLFLFWVVSSLYELALLVCVEPGSFFIWLSMNNQYNDHKGTSWVISISFRLYEKYLSVIYEHYCQSWPRAFNFPLLRIDEYRFFLFKYNYLIFGLLVL